MTTTRKYSCNLCRQEIVDGNGRGILFGIRPGALIEFKPPASVEHHICESCLEGIDAALHKAARSAA